MTRTAVIQAGHTGRTSSSQGSLGTIGEQALTARIAASIAAAFRDVDGWTCRVIAADEPTSRYSGDVFLALHADGSASPDATGASVGYRTDAGRALAAAWKRHYHDAGYRGPFRQDNYTAGLAGYYGTRHAVAAGTDRCAIVEHGFMTNRAERAWLESADGIAVATIAAVAAITGAVPSPPEPEPEPEPEPDEDPMTPEQIADLLDQIERRTRAVVDERIRWWFFQRKFFGSQSFTHRVGRVMYGALSHVVEQQDDQGVTMADIERAVDKHVDDGGA